MLSITELVIVCMLGLAASIYAGILMFAGNCYTHESSNNCRESEEERYEESIRWRGPTK